MKPLKTPHAKAVVSLMAILALVLASSCNKDNKKPDVIPDETLNGVTLSVTDTAVSVSSTFQLEVTFDPADWKDRTGEWSSTDNSIATVDENGTVTAIAKGNATIRFSASESIYDECSVEVYEEEIPLPDMIWLTEETVQMSVGETHDLNVIASGSDDWTHPDLIWESSDEETATISQSGLITANAFGTLLVRAVIGELEAYCLVSISDPSQPTEFDSNWLEAPYPYLEYPTTKERIIAAENASREDAMILRKLISDNGDQLSFEVRPYFESGPASPMFNNTFYDLSPEPGERFAWGYCLGIYRQDMVDGVMSEMMMEMGYLWKKNIERPDGTYAAWYANEEKNRSALIYVQPYDAEPDRMFGTIEYRILEDDPNNDGGGSGDAQALPERFMEFGASRDDVKAFEAENGGVINPEWCYSDSNLAFDITSDDSYSSFFVNYLFNDYGELYRIQLFVKDCSAIFADDNSTLNSDFVTALVDNGYSRRSETEYFSPANNLYVSFTYYDENIITGGSDPIVCVDYETN